MAQVQHGLGCMEASLFDVEVQWNGTSALAKNMTWKATGRGGRGSRAKCHEEKTAAHEKIRDLSVKGADTHHPKGRRALLRSAVSFC